MAICDTLNKHYSLNFWSILEGCKKKKKKCARTCNLTSKPLKHAHVINLDKCLYSVSVFLLCKINLKLNWTELVPSNRTISRIFMFTLSVNLFRCFVDFSIARVHQRVATLFDLTRTRKMARVKKEREVNLTPGAVDSALSLELFAI